MENYARSLEIDIVSLFPEAFVGPFDESMIKGARARGLLTIRHIDLRQYGEGKHKRVDDRPFGGGPGMVLKPEPLVSAIRNCKREESWVVALTPQGNLLTAKTCERLSQKRHLVLVCGHYEGIDERVLESEVDEEISIGDYILTSGVVPAIVLVDAVARFIPGVLGDPQSAYKESFQQGLLEGPSFTKPVDFEGKKVPEILLSGDHGKIEKWRKKEAQKKTKERRPDLYVSGVRGRPLPSKIETFLQVSDLKRAKSFYAKTLGFKSVEESDTLVAFAEGVALIEGEKKSEELFLVLKTDGQDEFEKIYSRLKKEKAVVGELKINQEGRKECAFKDPDGILWLLLNLPQGEKENGKE